MRNVVINSPSDPARTCGIANVGIRGMPPADMAKTLLDRYGIWTVAIDNNGVQGCRITPHVFILPRELDTFATAISDMSTAG